MDGVSPPPPFLAHPGRPTVEWAVWEGKFRNYLVAIGGESFSEQRQKAILLHCVGDEAYRVQQSLPPTVKIQGESDADLVLRQLRGFYTPQTNVIVERYKFRQRPQHSSETTAEYVVALRQLARTCSFGAMEDDLIRDVVVEKTSHPKLRERLLQDKDLTLDKVLTTAEAYERAVRESEVMAPQAAAVHKLTSKAPQYKGSRPKPDKPCLKCGRQHKPSDKCPAKNAVCYNCDKKGHFSSVCRSAPSGSSQPSGHRPRTQDCNELYVLACSDPSQGSKLTCAVTVTAGDFERDIELQVDTGASCSILSMSAARQWFKGVPYAPSDARLFGFGRNPLPVAGTLSTVVTYKGVSTPAKFLLVQTAGSEAIMGMDLMRELNVTVHPASHSVFKTEAELPAIKGYEHEIRLQPDAVPTAYRMRRLPYSVRDEVSAELKRLENSGVIERIEASPWVNPLTVTRKKDGSLRLCVDLRGPNAQIVAETHPLPTMEELESKLFGAVYSRIDLKSAYHQLRLKESSRDITAFLTHDGLWRFTRVPFGLVSSGSAFQKLLTNLLHGIDGCGHYLDDILVTGWTQQEHDDRLHEVKKRLQKANVTVNEEKSVYSQADVEFCGHHLSKQGIAPLTSAVQAVLDAPAPENVKELRSFLGTTAWFSKFVPQYSAAVQPLSALLRKDSVFEWSEEASTAFKSIKELISSSPVIQPFRPELKTVVTSDGCDRGAGAVLTQVQPSGEEKPVAYWSRSFSDAERRYSVSEKEALSAVNAVEHWRLYLWGRHFVLRTDHSALTTLLSPQASNRAGARIARWQSRLMPYSYSVEYRPGSLIPMADALSRLPLPDTGPEETDADEIVALITDDSGGAISDKELQTASDADPALQEVREAMRTGWPESLRKCSDTLRGFYPVRGEFQMRDDGIVLRSSDRVVVPASLVNRYLLLAHQSHHGVVRTKQLLRSIAWWPGMDSAAGDLVRDCPTCQGKDAVLSQDARPAPLQTVPLPDRSWSKLGVDIVGPIAGAPPSCRFAVTATDYFSKWPEVAFTSSVETEDIVRFLSTIFAREGYPAEIISDNGVQFVSREFTEYLTQRGIRHGRASLYWPRGNAAVERLNRELKCWILEASQQSPCTAAAWTALIRRRLALYRATPHSTTGVSPSELLHGRKMRLDLPVLTTAQPDVSLQRRVKTQQRRNARNYNRRQAVKTPVIQPGDTVRVKRQGHVPKNVSHFGRPLQVVRRVGKATFILSDGRRWNAAHLARQRATFDGGPPPPTGGTVVPSVPPPGTRDGRTVAPPSPLPAQPSGEAPSDPPPAEGHGAAAPSPLRPGPPATGESCGSRPSAPPPAAGPPSRELPPPSSGRRRFKPARLLD